MESCKQAACYNHKKKSSTLLVFRLGVIKVTRDTCAKIEVVIFSSNWILKIKNTVFFVCGLFVFLVLRPLNSFTALMSVDYFNANVYSAAAPSGACRVA